MNKSSKLGLVAILAAACVVGVSMTVMLSEPKPDDQREALPSWQEIRLQIADRPIKGLDELTKAHPIDDAFIQELEKHYADYWKLEVQVFVDAEEAKEKERAEKDEGDEEPDSFTPYPNEFYDTVLASDRYIKWCVAEDIDGKAWMAKLLRIRGFVYVMTSRELYDPPEIEKQIEAVQNDPNLPPKLKADAIKQHEADLDIANKMSKVLDTHEPDWSADERKTGSRYWKALSAFLASPEHSNFSKAEVDRKLREAEKSKVPERDEPEE